MAKNIYITESQFRKILESAGDLEYHFTPLENLCGMMEDDALDLTDSDYEEGRNGLSFLSLSRLRSSAAGYGWGMTRLDNSTGPVARIEFDGRKLNNIRNVNVRPYNYFYNNIGRTWKGRENSGSDASEFEDSLTLKDGRDQIVDAIDYITRIDVYLSDYQPDPETWQRFLDDLETYGDWAGKMHFYTDLNGFDYQRNEIPKSQIYDVYSGQMKQALEENKRKMGKRIYITENQFKNISEAVIRNLNSQNLSELLSKMESLSKEDYQNMNPEELWQVLVDISHVNANAYKGVGLSDEQKQFNGRIYAAKNKIISEIAPVLNESPYFKTNLSDGLFMVRNQDGRQISFHVVGIDSLNDLTYSDPQQSWDGVEQAYSYDDPKKYQHAINVFKKYRPLKMNIVADYTNKIKKSAIKMFSNQSVLDFLGITETPESVCDVVSQMRPFVTNNPGLHTEISMKSLFGNNMIVGNPKRFRIIADKIANDMGYNDANAVRDEITQKLTDIKNNTDNELNSYNYKNVVEENKRKICVKITESQLRKLIQEGISHILPPYEQWRKNIDLDNMQRQSPIGKPRYIIGNNLVIDMNGHATEHLGHDLLEATLRRVDFNMVNKYGQIKQTILFPFNIGYCECAETNDNDKIIYAKRGDRQRPSRIVLGREPEPCKYVQIVLQKLEQRPGKTLVPWKVLTAYVGKKPAKFEPWDPRSDESSVNFWKNHALISTYFDETSDEGDSEYWKKIDPKIDWATKGQQYKKAIEESNKMGKNIYITESQLSRILAENGMIDEHIAVIDNTSDAQKLVGLQWNNPDDVWFVQVTQRKKDFRSYNKRHGGTSKWWSRVPGPDGTSRENFVGYGLVQGSTKQEAMDSLKNITIHLNPWAAKIIGQTDVKSNGGMEAIYSICDKLWARAYITINKRSLSRTQRIAKNRPNDPRAFEKELSRNHRDENYYPWSMTDMDIDHPNAWSETDSALNKISINPVISHGSHDGKHYFFNDRKIMKYSEHSPEFAPIAKKYAANKQPGEAFTMKYDAKMMIYSPCGQ
ncbi:MAG: hypothetical protein J6X18_06670 [Bacteroidales bacterium]|nr:hypothetical protein [Bacteroidales bacterium]